MDDPWGSPWTNTAPAERTPSPAKSDLEPPPRAVLSTASSPRLPAVSVQSPWADDDDGFGDWTGADVSTPVQSASGWGGGGWGGAGSDTAGHQNLTPTPKDDGFGFAQASPIAWPGSIALSPGPKHGSGSAFRHPSPDPWASEFDDLKEAQNAQSTPRLVLNEPASPTPQREPKVDALEEELGSVWTDGVEGEGANAAADGPVASHNAEEDMARSTTIVDNALEAIETVNADQSAPTSSKPRSSHSRSSSGSRNGSDSDRDRQDSPITSIDEDAKSRMALSHRKVSGKIQVLVEKFDGLAKAAVEDTVPVRRDQDAAPQTAGASDTESPSEEVADFGDFEEAEDAFASATSLESSPPSPRQSLERTPTPRVQSPRSPIRQRAPSMTETTPERPTTASSDFRSPTTKLVPAKFDVDLQQLDSLFDDIDQEAPASNEDIHAVLPDHIITDSFEQISERKAWYRISRQGSSRMHNSGDDDTYRRVAWPTSTVHDETLKIVRRWMEQDSITGRTTLGGGSNRTNLFNWDSSAEPVTLDQVFAKRRRPTHARPVSLQQPLQIPSAIPAASTATASAPRVAPPSPKQRPMSLAGPPTAAFGWSTSPVKKRPVEVPRQIKPDRSNAPAALPRNQISAPPIQAPAPPDEEDDWGEMVSSPTGDAKATSFSSFVAPVSSPLGASIPGPTSAPLSPNQPPLVPAVNPLVNGPRPDIPALWEQPLPDKQPKSPPVDPWMTLEPLQMSGPPPKPTVTSITTDATVSTLGFTPNTPLTILSPLAVSEATPRERTVILPPPIGDSQTEADLLVRQIVDNLPDLSYMLR